jgi:4-amino-4-deoxy-L-arabinose transferase-like glycosyltransferase
MLNRLATRNHRLVIFLVAYAVAWTLIAWMSDSALHFDVQEEIAWGREWPLWLYRHPPMKVWLLEIANHATGFAIWTSFLLSVGLFGLCQWAIAKILEEAHSRELGFAGAVLNTSIYLFSLHIVLWNANTVQLAFAGLFVFGIWRALERGGLVWWLLAGAAAAGGMLSKISFATIVIAVTLAVVAFPVLRARISWGKAFAGGLLAIVLVAPTYWAMVEHFDVVRRFVTERMAYGGSGGLFGRIQLVILILASIAWMMILPLLAIWIGLRDEAGVGADEAGTAMRRRRALLLLGAAGPGSLAVVLVSITAGGGGFKDHWIMANMVFLVPFALLALRGRSGAVRWTRTGWALAVFWIVFPLVFHTVSRQMLLAGAEPQTDSLKYPIMPPQPLVSRAEALWDRAAAGRDGLRSDVPFVAGFTDAALLANHLSGRPAWFHAFSLATSQWIEPDSITREGVLAVGPIPDDFADRYGLCVAGGETVEWPNRRGVTSRVVELTVLLPQGACG